ncbi:GAF domain-containing sensor histidine kinase [Legionella sainthelensi]|uniref:histidine kinase n=1 Tax=Legionella sainthelensi TaxID=28087 RepID=A0A2H5FRL7_9GAMM|nr:GAF domain-containing sensor histidine kinase [Legionella sainthelensi]AUH74208.1 hypothetical protein CAB17_19885 [Legionella sainthelensi]
MIISQEQFFKIEQIFLGIIDIAIAIAKADFGNIQLIDNTTQHLKIVAQRGFPQYWLNYWDKVAKEQGTCRSALEQAGRVVIEDICNSPLFQGESLDIQLRAGVKAVQSTTIVNSTGKIIGKFSIHYKIPHKPNIHSLKVLDILAKHAADAIEHNEMLKKLIKRQEELKQEIDVRDEFISLLGHELRNSLTSSKINAQVCKRSLEQDKFDKIKLNKVFDLWIAQIKTLENISEPILDTTAISEGLFSFNPQEIDINELLMRITQRFSKEVSYNCISVIGYCDPFRIEQIVINLITNGIKYGKGKPIHVELLIEKKENLKIMVKDFGIGIAPENREKIFKKFARVNHKSIQSGLGLGLYIVNQIVTRLKGNINLESQVGIGSTFIVTLPLHIDTIKSRNERINSHIEKVD